MDDLILPCHNTHTVIHFTSLISCQQHSFGCHHYTSAYYTNKYSFCGLVYSFITLVFPLENKTVFVSLCLCVLRFNHKKGN